MSRSIATADHLFDRPWRAGRPFKPATGRARRWSMILLLLLLCAVIGGYGYLTDSQRVRRMAETYLSNLVGGRVEVGRATLSVFEGLRLDDVKVHVDDDFSAPDSVLFSAQTFVIKYDPRSMVGGRLEASQIVAQKPQVLLAQNRQTGLWNYNRLGRGRARSLRPSFRPRGKPLALPEVLLRNARVEISEVRDTRLIPLGFMDIEGRLSPGEEDRYAFALQSRGSDLGPSVSGSVSLGTGQVTAQLHNFVFGRDIRSMLPADVRDWWERHGLSGALEIPTLLYTPSRGSRPAGFKVVTALNGVTLSVPPEEWIGARDVRRQEQVREALFAVSGLYRTAGFDVQPGRETQDGSREAAAPEASEAPRETIDCLLAMLRPPAIRLRNVAGSFVFTQDGIDVRDVSGRVENNGLSISGRIAGYRPDAPVELHIASLASENIIIPPSPRYVSSMPGAVREIYEQFRPEGKGQLWVQVSRADSGARPEVRGEVTVVDGKFVFGRFPYPLREVTGRIGFGPDGSGKDRVVIHVRGRGPENGPNRDATIAIDSFDGHIAPLGPECGINVLVTGRNVSCDSVLRQAFAPDVQQALKVFDAPGHGEFPKFRGDFDCRVVRPIGKLSHWSFDTDVHLADGSGSLVAFPYPLRNVTGDLKIRSGYADVSNLTMKQGDASVIVNGRVAFHPEPPASAQPGLVSHPPEFRTILDVTVRGMALDDTLIASLPPDRRELLQKLGIQGKLDVDGKLFSPDKPDRAATPPTTPSETAPLDYAFDMTLREGTLQPGGGEFKADAVSGNFHLTREELQIKKVEAKRDKAVLAASGALGWSGTPRLKLEATAKDLTLDAPLYSVLPPSARSSWDELRPQGSIDAALSYDGAVGRHAESTEPSPSSASTRESGKGLQLVLKPRQLAVTPKTVPYKLEEVTGTVTVNSQKVTLDEITAHHGEAKIAVSGSGVPGARPVWDLKLSGKEVAVDDDFRRALPTTLCGLVEALKLQGKVGFDISRLHYRSGESAAAPAPASQPAAKAPATTRSNDSDPEIDLTATLALSGAQLDVGVPLSEVIGQLDLDASVRNGHLDKLKGTIASDSMTLAGRSLRHFKAALLKPVDKSELRVAKMQAELAGGEMAGDVSISYPENAPSRYNVGLVVRNADVTELAKETDKNVEARLTASLSLEGSWGDPTARRGRGDVVVDGKGMYRVPLVLGLLQVTNLALPVSGPFNEATAAYSLEGQRVNFEKIELKSDTMLMTGGGHLDFENKQVRLSFVTDNPGGLKLPFLNDLWQGARNEMLRIHVRGTIQEPKVAASSMGTFTTTVDEVFKGDAPEKKRKAK